MAVGEQFYVGNPSNGFLNFTLLQLTTPTLFELAFGVVDVNQGNTYNSDGSITPQTNLVVASAFDFYAPFHAQAAAAMVDQSFYIAPFPVQVSRIDFVAAVAETTAATLNVQVTKDVSTDAPGAGTDLLTNNVNAGFNAKATANTVQNGILTGTIASLQLAVGNRLSVDFSAAATELVGVTIIVSLFRL